MASRQLQRRGLPADGDGELEVFVSNGRSLPRVLLLSPCPERLGLNGFSASDSREPTPIPRTASHWRSATERALTSPEWARAGSKRQGQRWLDALDRSATGAAHAAAAVVRELAR